MSKANKSMIVNLRSDLVDNAECELQVRVVPRAAANFIKVESQLDGSKLVKVYVTATPEDGKANQAIIKLLADKLGVSKSAIQIKHGSKSKHKIVVINQRL